MIFNPHRGDLAMAVRGHKDEELVIIAKWIEGTLMHLINSAINSNYEAYCI